MNRKERRRAEALIGGKFGVGSVIHTAIVTAILSTGERALYWIVVPAGMSLKEATDTQEWQGPFKTAAEVAESEQVTLFGKQCKVTHRRGVGPCVGSAAVT